MRFLIGTQCLKAENSIHCVEYDEESVLVSKFIYQHPAGEIWQTNAHPNLADIVGTVHSKLLSSFFCIPLMIQIPFFILEESNHKMTATIYRMGPVPELGQSVDTLDSSTPGQLEVLGNLKSREETEVARLLWQPNEGNKLVTVSTDSRVNLWDFTSSGRIQVIVCLT